MRKICLLIILLFLASSITLAQNHEDYKNHPGYFDFNKSDAYKNIKKKVEIGVEGPLLNVLSQLTSSGDPDLGSILDKLLFIRTHIIKTDKNKVAEIQPIISRFSKELKSKHWERLVYIKENDKEIVEIFIRYNKKKLSGLVIMVSDTSEAVFVNLVGEIDLNKIGKLGSKFNIPKIDEIKDVNKQKEKK